MNPTHFSQPPPQKLRRLSSISSIPSPSPDPDSSAPPSPAATSAAASIWKGWVPAAMVPLSEPGRFAGEGECAFGGDETLVGSTQGLGLFSPQQPSSEPLGHDAYPVHHRHRYHHHNHHHHQQQYQQPQVHPFPRNRPQQYDHHHYGYHNHQNNRGPYAHGYFPTPSSSSPSDLSFTPLDFRDHHHHHRHHQPSLALPSYPIRDQLDLPDGLFDTEVPEIFMDHPALALAPPSTSSSSLPLPPLSVPPKNPGPAMDSPVTSSPPGSPQKDLQQRRVSNASRKRSIEELSADNSVDSLFSSPSSCSSSPELKSQRTTEPTPVASSSSATTIATSLTSDEPQSLVALLELQSKLRKESSENEHGFDSERILRQSKQMRNKLRSILGKLRKTM